MSSTYQDLDLTTFPETVDQSYIMIDPSTSADLAAIAQYDACISAGNMQGAIDVLNANARLQKMVFNAEKWNRLNDMIIAVERYYMSDVQDYLVSIVTYKGDYDATVAYEKYDVVNYTIGGVTQSYMAIQNAPAGTLPTNATYFVTLTLRGAQGPSGTGLAWCGEWDTNTAYSVSDCVSHNGSLWGAVADNTGSEPSATNTSWAVAMSFDDKADKVTGAVVGNFAGLDANGNLTDSGKKAADFANAVHSHAQSDVTDLATTLAGKAALVHSHAQSDVTGLSASLASKANAADTTTALATKADKTVTVSGTLTVAGWSGTSAPYTQTVTGLTGVTASNKIAVGLSDSAMDTQFEDAAGAVLRPTAQASGSVTVKAVSDKPTVDLPITVHIFG